MKDTAAIPKGGFCYRVVRLRPGELLSKEIARFGKDLREYSHHGDWKEVLCPYWHRTDYGMVRCDYLESEGLDENDRGAMEKAIRHFGSEELLWKAHRYSLLYDEIKVCGVKEDEDEEWEDPLT
jgi:hypothetical protein